MTGARKIYCVSHVTLLLLISYFPGCSGSHFRGGIIMWKPTETENEVRVATKIHFFSDPTPIIAAFNLTIHRLQACEGS